MRICLLFVLLLNVLAFAGTPLQEEKAARRAFIEKLDDAKKKFLADTRDSLLASLQANDVESTMRYVKGLTDSAYGDYALDKYELLQIYFLTNQLDSAIVTLVRDYDEHMYSHRDGYHLSYYKKQWYSAFDDKLIEFLDANMDLTNRDVLQEQLNRISNSDISQEFKDLAELMKMEFSRNVIKNKSVACFAEEVKKGRMSDLCAQRDEIYQMRYGVWKDDFVDKDSVYYDSLFSMFASFQNNYPDSEFRSWAIKHRHLANQTRKRDFRRQHYYLDRLYTGGIGGEFFISPSNSDCELNIVLQYKRFILTANHGQDPDFLDGWNVLLGVDVFENKLFKIVPFVGGYNTWMAGLQFEFRPWISEMGHDAPIGGYLSLKAKYVFKYGENGGEADDYKKHSKHRFYLGVGFHFW
ncbi:hypothetical protein [Fibrobacter sp. UWB12]|uniref:hypothetical protein n=1 Tax=Fibrobacter sp. UWB12 TaxID=1896203 RepID=UPI00091A5480|nr:hypothetical protein [Fibrobacter sp. UWB12]SHK71437.1 hypothetical protein SAMN05720759_105286 [Fibrobacter sp. UWB12]